MDLSRTAQFLSLPLSVQWRALLVRLAWLVPSQILKFTNPLGPAPTVLHLPSRATHKIPVHLFLPPSLATTTSTSSPSSPSSTSSSSQICPEREKVPIHLDFHGGGFIAGGLLEQAPWCAQLARETGRIVVTVDYRIGPLDKFPAAVKDAEDVLRSIFEVSSPSGVALRATLPAGVEIDTERLSLSGFSSGGNLALNLVLSIPELDWPCLLPDPESIHNIPVLLFYPSLDCRLLPHQRPWPAHLPKPAKGLFASFAEVLWPTYLPTEEMGHLRASPGLVETSNVHERAWVYLVLTEVDTLNVQSGEWVEKVGREGWLNERFKVEMMEGMVHGFTQFPDAWLEKEVVAKKHEILGRAVEFVREVGGT